MIVDLRVKRARAMHDGRQITAEGFGELLEAFLREWEERREAQQVREDVLVRLIGQGGGRNGDLGAMDPLEGIIGRRMKAGE